MAKLKDIVGGSRLPDGEYLVTIVSVTDDVSQTGHAKLTFKAATQDGSTVIWSRSLQPQALWKLGRDLLAAGVVDEDTEISDDPDQRAVELADLAHQLQHEQVRISVTITTNKVTGQSGSEVSIIGPAAVRAQSRADALANL